MGNDSEILWNIQKATEKKETWQQRAIHELARVNRRLIDRVDKLVIALDKIERQGPVRTQQKRKKRDRDLRPDGTKKQAVEICRIDGIPVYDYK